MNHATTSTPVKLNGALRPKANANVAPRISGRSIAPASSVRAAERGSAVGPGLNQVRDHANSQAPTTKSTPVIRPAGIACAKVGTVWC
jgi:hypothetical protein